jgi:hypothetical protein
MIEYPRERKRQGVQGVLMFVALVIVAALLARGGCDARAQVQQSCMDWDKECQQWQEYNAAIAGPAQAEAGEVVVPKKKGDAGTVAAGIKDNLTWCLTPKQPCATRTPKRTARRWNTYGQWFADYSTSGYEAVYMAVVSTFTFIGEPKNPPKKKDKDGTITVRYCSKDSVLRECGLMGLKLRDAKACDVNVCSPRASTWCAADLGENQIQAFLAAHPGAALLSWELLYQFASVSSGIGSAGGYLIRKSGCLTVGDDGALVYKDPMGRLLAYAKSLDRFKKIVQSGKLPSLLDAVGNKKKLAAHAEALFAGRISNYTTGKRLGRIVATNVHVHNFHRKLGNGDTIPFKAPGHVPRPVDLAPYPGDALHGQCQKFKSLMQETAPPAVLVEE